MQSASRQSRRGQEIVRRCKPFLSHTGWAILVMGSRKALVPLSKRTCQHRVPAPRAPLDRTGVPRQCCLPNSKKRHTTGREPGDSVAGQRLWLHPAALTGCCVQRVAAEMVKRERRSGGVFFLRCTPNDGMISFVRSLNGRSLIFRGSSSFGLTGCETIQSTTNHRG